MLNENWFLISNSRQAVMVGDLLKVKGRDDGVDPSLPIKRRSRRDVRWPIFMPPIRFRHLSCCACSCMRYLIYSHGDARKKIFKSNCSSSHRGNPLSFHVPSQFYLRGEEQTGKPEDVSLLTCSSVKPVTRALPMREQHRAKMTFSLNSQQSSFLFLFRLEMLEAPDCLFVC